MKAVCDMCRGEYPRRSVWTIPLDDGAKRAVCAPCRVLQFRPEIFDYETILEACEGQAVAGHA